MAINWASSAVSASGLEPIIGGGGGGIGGSGTDERIMRWDGAINAQSSAYSINDSGNMTMIADADFIPSVDETGELGTDSNKWARIRAAEVVTGDLVLNNDERNALWRIIEHEHNIEFLNEKTGVSYFLINQTEVK